MQKRTMEDRLICGFNSVRYAIMEPITLKLMRATHEHLYYDTKEDPLVTVYTPTYNRARLLLERALPTVLAQTYKKFEYIIVGDCCTDDTQKLLSEVNDPRIKFYNLPERNYRYPPTAENHWLAGPVVPANQGLKLARGKWIARIDDDDTWTPDHIEVLLRFAQKENYEFVSAAYLVERHGNKRSIAGVYAEDPYYTRKKELPKNTGPLIGGTSTWLYRSYLSFFKYNLNCWRKAWNRVNDIDLSLRIYKARVRMSFLDQIVLYVSPRPGETTVGLEAYMLQEKGKLEHYKF